MHRTGQTLRSGKKYSMKKKKLTKHVWLVEVTCSFRKKKEELCKLVMTNEQKFIGYTGIECKMLL